MYDLFDKDQPKPCWCGRKDPERFVILDIVCPVCDHGHKWNGEVK